MKINNYHPKKSLNMIIYFENKFKKRCHSLVDLIDYESTLILDDLFFPFGGDNIASKTKNFSNMNEIYIKNIINERYSTIFLVQSKHNFKKCFPYHKHQKKIHRFLTC